MNFMRNVSIAIVAIVVVAGIGSAQEKRIKRSDLPPAVEKTVVEVRKTDGGTIKGLNKEIEKGKISYEVEMLVNGHSKDIQIDPSGTVTEVEEQVDMDSLSPEVKAGLTAKAGGRKISKVESLMKKGKLVAYEAVVQTGSKKSEIQVGPDGKPLDHEE
ncbi:MAG: hypothetical protein NVS9B4_24060 [Candidatus Acidiferrum sp.]